jgi:hypothetical protein
MRSINGREGEEEREGKIFQEVGVRQSSLYGQARGTH